MTDNRELKRLREEQKAKAQGRRFIALRWVLEGSEHASYDEACQALASNTHSAKERVGIVDRETGNSWTRQTMLESVMRYFEENETSAPPRLRRMGPVGRVQKPTGKKP